MWISLCLSLLSWLLFSWFLLWFFLCSYVSSVCNCVFCCVECLQLRVLLCCFLLLLCFWFCVYTYNSKYILGVSPTAGRLRATPLLHTTRMRSKNPDRVNSVLAYWRVGGVSARITQLWKPRPKQIWTVTVSLSHAINWLGSIVCAPPT